MNATLQKIMKAKDTKDETMVIPEWDDAVVVIREPVRSVVNEISSKYLKTDPVTGVPMEGSDMDKFGNSLLMAMMFDEDGNQIFESLEQVTTVLDGKSVRVQKRLLEKCTEIVHGPSAEGVEVAEGNSGAIPS